MSHETSNYIFLIDKRKRRWFEWSFLTNYPYQVIVKLDGEEVDYGYARNLDRAIKYGEDMARRHYAKAQDEAKVPLTAGFVAGEDGYGPWVISEGGHNAA